MKSICDIEDNNFIIALGHGLHNHRGADREVFVGRLRNMIDQYAGPEVSARKEITQEAPKMSKTEAFDAAHKIAKELVHEGFAVSVDMESGIMVRVNARYCFCYERGSK